MKRSSLVHIHLDPRDPSGPDKLRTIAAAWERDWPKGGAK